MLWLGLIIEQTLWLAFWVQLFRVRFYLVTSDILFLLLDEAGSPIHQANKQILRALHSSLYVTWWACTPSSSSDPLESLEFPLLHIPAATPAAYAGSRLPTFTSTSLLLRTSSLILTKVLGFLWGEGLKSVHLTEVWDKKCLHSLPSQLSEPHSKRLDQVWLHLIHF